MFEYHGASWSVSGSLKRPVTISSLALSLTIQTLIGKRAFAARSHGAPWLNFDVTGPR